MSCVLLNSLLRKRVKRVPFIIDYREIYVSRFNQEMYVTYGIVIPN